GGDGGVFDAGDDAVAAPAIEPLRGLAAAAFVEVDVPGAVLADVGADAVEDAAGVFVGGFDDECDAAAVGAGWVGVAAARHRNNRITGVSAVLVARILEMNER